MSAEMPFFTQWGPRPDWDKLNRHEQRCIRILLNDAGYCAFDDDDDVWDQYRDGIRITKIQRFVSDTPGFCGTIYLLVFPGGPEFSLVITRHAPDELNETWRIEGYGSEMIPEKGVKDERHEYRSKASS